MMNIHEFGKENDDIILLIPALPGYDFEDDRDFTSVEQIASELNDWLSTRGYRNLYALWADKNVPSKTARWDRRYEGDVGFNLR